MSKIDKAFSEYIKQVKKDYPQELIDKSAAKADFKGGYEACQKEYEEKLRWIPIAEPPKKAELIILEYSFCSNSKKHVIYDFDPEYFEGVFHINGVAERWRSFFLKF